MVKMGDVELYHWGRAEFLSSLEGVKKARIIRMARKLWGEGRTERRRSQVFPRGKKDIKKGLEKKKECTPFFKKRGGAWGANSSGEKKLRKKGDYEGL